MWTLCPYFWTNLCRSCGSRQKKSELITVEGHADMFVGTSDVIMWMKRVA